MPHQMVTQRKALSRIQGLWNIGRCCQDCPELTESSQKIIWTKITVCTFIRMLRIKTPVYDSPEKSQPSYLI